MAEMLVKTKVVAFDGTNNETTLLSSEGDQRVAFTRFAAALFADVTCNIRIDVVSYSSDGKEVSVITPVELIHSVC